MSGLTACLSFQVRRISIVTGEFRPISMELIPDPSPCKIVELPADADMEASVEVAPATEGDGAQKTGGRKKRKKKALTKKKGVNKKTSANGVGQAEQTEAGPVVAPAVLSGGVGAVQPAQGAEDASGENIFQIDDLGDSFEQTDSAQQVSLFRGK